MKLATIIRTEQLPATHMDVGRYDSRDRGGRAVSGTAAEQRREQLPATHMDVGR